MLAQYPVAGAVLLLNTFLLTTTEGIATGDLLSANYHFSWFRALSPDRQASGRRIRDLRAAGQAPSGIVSEAAELN